jgi:hypothetical protein
VHWNAHPMDQVPLATVNGELVQFPCVSGVGPRRTVEVPFAPLTVVVVTALVGGDVDPDVAGGCVVALVLPATVVEVADAPCGGGRVYTPPVAVFGVVGLLSPDQVMSIPSKRQASPKTRSCHVCQDRRSLMPSSPRPGAALRPPGRGAPADASFVEDVITGGGAGGALTIYEE